MNQELRFRPAIDLDELDRQLRTQPARPGVSGSYDPLAELARIVGQPDARAATAPPSSESRGQQPHIHDRWLDGEPTAAPALRDAFPVEPPGDAGHADDGHDGRPIPVAAHAPPRRSLLNARSLIIATVVVAGALGGLYATFAMRGASGVARSKEPPVIVAKATPAKEKPENPGGTEVANQNAQIYERKPEDVGKKPNVVSNVEQPVDLSASVKRDAPRVILPGPDGKGISSASPGGSAQASSPAVAPGASAVAAFAPTQPPAPPPGATPSSNAPIVTSAVPNTLTPPPPVASNEPKRVKSVAIRAPVYGESSPQAEALTAPPTPAPSVPTPKPVSRGVAPGVTPANSTPAVTTARPPAAAAAKVAARETPKETVRGRTPPAAAQPVPDADPPADAAAESDDGPLKLAPPPKGARSAAGGWSVQLASRPTEVDAKTEAVRLGQRYSSTLEGASPRVVSGAANGGTVYRVRVGSYSREKASQMCESIKSAGGICFISKS